MYSKELWFRITNTVASAGLPADTQASFEFGGPHDIYVLLRPVTTEEIGQGHRNDSAFAVASGRFVVSPSLIPVFEGLEQGRVPDPQRVLSDAFGQHAIEPDGTVKPGEGINARWLGDEYLEFTGQVTVELGDVLRRTVLLARWRQDSVGDHRPFGGRPSEWSMDGKRWQHLPTPGLVDVWHGPLLRFTDTGIAELLDLARQGLSEPLGHQLLREAWEQRHRNPRSALLVGIAALEVGVKQYVSEAAPETRWLMEETLTPPLVSMLKNYLPSLGGQGRPKDELVRVPRTIRRVLDDGIKLRNKVAHAGTAQPSGFDVRPLLEAIRDTLWILDYNRGFDWAIDHIRAETRSELTAAEREGDDSQ